MTIAEAVGDRIEVLLSETAMSKKALALKSGLSKKKIDDLLAAKCKSPDMRSVYALSYGFGITVSEFFDDGLFDFNVYDFDF